VRFHPDGTILASCSADHTIKLFDVRTHQLLQHYEAHEGAVNSIEFHPSGDFLLSASDDTALKVWDLREGHQLYTIHGHQSSVLAASFSPAGDYFVSGGCDELVMVWKTNFDRVIGTFFEMYFVVCDCTLLIFLFFWYCLLVFLQKKNCSINRNRTFIDSLRDNRNICSLSDFFVVVFSTQCFEAGFRTCISASVNCAGTLRSSRQEEGDGY
jgi:hypothetical protein